MSAPRRPEEVLAELGRRLDAGYAARPRRRLRLPGRPRRRSVVALAALVTFAGPTAVATQDALRAPSPPVPPGTEARAERSVYVARGVAGGVAWRLSASVCRGRADVGLFLTVPGGGGGARCDVAPPSGAARSFTYFDPQTRRTWAFGALPAPARRVEVTSRGFTAGRPDVTAVPAVPVDPATEPRGVPAGLRTFVVALPGARAVPRVVALDDAGEPVLRCRQGRCTTPIPEAP